jgi:hypothetical protein
MSSPPLGHSLQQQQQQQQKQMLHEAVQLLQEPAAQLLQLHPSVSNLPAAAAAADAADVGRTHPIARMLLLLLLLLLLLGNCTALHHTFPRSC